MRSASKYKVIKAWAVGANAPAAGDEVTLTPRQAAYPLAMGCLKPLAHAQKKTNKKKTEVSNEQ